MSFLAKDEFKQKSVHETSYTAVSYIGKVISNDDPFDANRIQVRIKGIDDNVKDKDLTWCVPMLPLFFYNLPQVGEPCKVVFSNLAKKQSKREWIGPVINQYQNCLGNYLLLSKSHNCSISNNPFNEKLETYIDLKQQNEISGFITESGLWDNEAIAARKNKIVQFVMDNF